MTTLLTAILYLWLALTILLVVMWFLREQDRRNKDQHQNELEDELLNGPAGAGSEPATPAATGNEPVEAEKTEPDPVEPKPASEPESEPEHQESESKSESVDDEPSDTEESAKAADEQTADVEPLPWSKNAKKRKKKPSQRKPPKTKSKVKVATEEPPVEEPAVEEPQTEEPAADEPIVEEAPVEESQAEEPAVDEAGANEAVDEAVVEESPSEIAAQLPGIVDLLNGVTLPFDLTPLTARIEDPDRHAIFISPHPDAAEVGTAFADELVQQGFEIEAAGFDQALATRGDETLSMRISPDAGTVADGSDLRYPTAGETDVAIEVWVGNGSPPPLLD